jgi:hypothetical protein
MPFKKTEKITIEKIFNKILGFWVLEFLKMFVSSQSMKKLDGLEKISCNVTKIRINSLQI